MRRWLRAWNLAIACWPVVRVLLLVWIAIGWIVAIPLAIYIHSPH